MSLPRSVHTDTRIGRVMLIDPSVCDASAYSADSSRANTEFERDCITRTMISPDYSHFVRREFANMSMLMKHIKRIIFLCSDEEMCRVYARRIVAPMKYAVSFSKRILVQLPRDAMGKLKTAIHSETPVSLCVCARRPQPAPVLIFRDRLIESIKNRTKASTVTRAASLWSVLSHSECFIAGGAGGFYDDSRHGLKLILSDCD